MYYHTDKEKGMKRGWLHLGKDDRHYISYEFCFPRFACGLTLSEYGDKATLGISPIFFSLYLSSSWPRWLVNKMRERQIGFYFYNWSLVLSPFVNTMMWSRDFPWWQKGYTIHLPFQRKHFRTSYLMNDGSWINEKKGPHKLGETWQNPRDIEGRFKEVHDYTYTRKNGEVQKRKATITVEEREWRRFKNIPLFRMIRRSIDVEFDGEVGERTGSWKGGCIGCGIDLLPNETPLKALRRMEATRRFN